MSIRYEYDYTWDAGARTISSLTGNGCFEFSVPKTAIGVVCGLNSQDTGASRNDIKYGFYIDKGRYAIIESGVLRNSLQPFPSDVALFKIERIEGIIRYYVDVGTPCETGGGEEPELGNSIWLEGVWLEAIYYEGGGGAYLSALPNENTIASLQSTQPALVGTGDRDWYLFSEGQIIEIVTDLYEFTYEEETRYLTVQLQLSGIDIMESSTAVGEGDNWVYTFIVPEGASNSYISALYLGGGMTLYDGNNDPIPPQVEEARIVDIRSSNGGLANPTLPPQLVGIYYGTLA